jgi:hypothetical protein
MYTLDIWSQFSRANLEQKDLVLLRTPSSAERKYIDRNIKKNIAICECPPGPSMRGLLFTGRLDLDVRLGARSREIYGDLHFV